MALSSLGPRSRCPAAVGHLALEKVLHAARLLVEVDVAHPVHEGDDVGNESRVDQELAHPVAVGLLLAEEMLLGPRDRFPGRGVEGGGDRLAEGFQRNFDGPFGEERS